MGFLKKLTGIFGFGHNDGGHGAAARDEDGEGDNTGSVSEDGDKRREGNQARFRETGLPRRGFGVPVQVAVERSSPGPILQPCAASDGGVQGLRWYSMRLRIDEDGDVADEFLEDDNCKTLPRKCKTKAAKVRGLVISSDGKLQPLMH
ncbi:uncharacterized protein LOC103853728 [Brassica rapa]|uniref:Uncharacterized protein n=2 Tax=Brassica TaxID=3705 RepID=M4DZV2_BRACM|nr:uncharacterized protein LOC103853728 [Brassica rapa]XP_013718656.1 uncharacterized protein BNAANNG36270D [Brassica napus]XP_048628978.1 uncharacterized protein LOC125600039 [Brassica napus]KAH0851564.1 hypothetical protein HID58_090275 [Brassica napus]KAH0939388.1 hypothetical protein HID58_006849 [Brassica napus]CAF2142494.1 unnamed protein product [Brassica napus]CDY71140.1 BnaAnng36270D [Brassica napus]